MVSSRAVMERRHSSIDDLDLFPTYPWVTRGFLSQALCVDGVSVWEPACGFGHMSEVLKEFGARVWSTDIFDHGYAGMDAKVDFTMPRGLVPLDLPPFGVDWVFTNPPFKVWADFVLRALEVAKIGVVVYGRLGALESGERHSSLYLPGFLETLWVMVERAPVTKGRVDADGGSATPAGWYVFKKKPVGDARVRWIRPCREKLERPYDYDMPNWPPQRIVA